MTWRQASDLSAVRQAVMPGFERQRDGVRATACHHTRMLPPCHRTRAAPHNAHTHNAHTHTRTHTRTFHATQGRVGSRWAGAGAGAAPCAVTATGPSPGRAPAAPAAPAIAVGGPEHVNVEALCTRHAFRLRPVNEKRERTKGRNEVRKEVRERRK